MSIDLCPEQKQLHDFVTGRLPETSLESIAEHLETCGDCDRSVATMENESDSFVEELKCPTGDEAFLSEPEFRQVVGRVRAFGGEAELAPTAPKSNRQMLGQYMLVERLGTGGMGTVYKALHTKLEKFVAFKILRTKRTLDDHAIARFEREMKAVGKLKHENIVQASDAGEADGKQFLVMEYVEGAEFSELIRQHHRLSVADACELVRQAAVGLQHALDHGLVHRDVKPSNLMLAKDGCVKVLDLGLARYADEQFSTTVHQGGDIIENDGLTHVGQIMGTVEYIAPEQASNSHDVDIRADVYGLGCTLFALLAGAPPFPRMEFASTKELVHAHQMSDRPSLRDGRDFVPPELARIINKMLAIDPDDRFSSPAEVATALSQFTAGANLAALLTSEQPAKSNHNPTPERGRFVPWAITLTILSLVAVVALSVILSLKAPHGTVEIETDDKNVEISVKQGGEEIEIINAESGWKIRLKEGAYDVDLKGAKDKFKLDRRSITVTRDDKVTVRVLLKEAPQERVGRVDQNLLQKRSKRRSYMLEFSGRQTHVVIPKLQYDGSHPITFEATVMSLYRGSIIANFRGAGLGLDVADGYVSFHVNDGRTADNGYVRVKSRTSVGRHKPVHIAGVLDGTTLRLFVDGKLQGSETIGKFNKSTFPFMIGADPGGQGEPTQFLNGFIDEVRVSKTARYDKDFSPPGKLESDDNTMVLYRFDEGEGDVANDASGHALHGKIHSPKWVAANESTETVEPEAIQRLREFGATITKKDGEITEILIGNSLITDADMAGFESIDSLESLTVFGCMNVTDATFARLKKLPQLKVLNIAPSNITDVGVENLKGLKDLSFLSLNGTKVTDAGLRHLIDNSKIRVLYLNETKITDKGLVFLEQMKDMHSLDLGATAVTDAGLAHLGHMSKLHQLHLSRSAVTDAGMEQVSRLSNIVSSRLNDTSISDAGLAHLAKLPKLQDLQVLNTKVTQKGIDALKRALPRVIVRQNVAAAPAADFSKYGQAAELMRWSATLDSRGEHVHVELDDEGRVTSVHMGGGDITDEGLSHLKELRDVETLELTYTYGCSADGLRHVQQMTNVKKLNLWGNYNFSAGYLSGMTKVKTLFLHKLRVTDENMKFIKGMKGCKVFQMTLNPTVTDAGIAHLAGLTELESIYLTCPQLTDECLKYFHDMSKLNSLSISSPHVTNAALQRLAKTLPNLKTVNNEPVEKLFENNSEEKPADGEAEAERKQDNDDRNQETADKSPKPDGNIASTSRPQLILGFVPRIEEIKRDQQATVPASHWPNALEEIRKGMAKKFPKMALKQDYRGEHGLQHLIYRHRSDAILLTLNRCNTPREAGEYGSNDSSIGHTIISVSNVYRTLEAIGWQDAETALRICATKCINDVGDLDRANAVRASRATAKMPADWASSRSDKGAVLELISMFREGRPDEACESIYQPLLSGKVHAGAVWDAIFLATNELSVRFKWGGLLETGRPRHSITGTNALHCAFRTHSDPEVRLYALLQAVAMTCSFIAIPRADGLLNDFKITEITKTEGPNSVEEAVDEIFSLLSPRRSQHAFRDRSGQDRALELTYAMAQEHSDQRFLQTARRLLCLKSTIDPHDVKFAVAGFESYRYLSEEWRPNYLAASVFLLHGTQMEDNPAVQEAREELRRL